MVCYIHQCWLCVCICGCVVKGELKLVSSDYNDSYCVQVDDRGAPWSAEDIILFYKLCIWAWPFLLHCSASVIHVKKKRAVVWKFLLFSPHFKSKLLHCGSSLYDHCEPSGSNGQSHRNWVTRAVSAWQVHRPQGAPLSSGSCWEDEIFWFVFIAGNKCIYKTNNQEISLSGDILKRAW